MKRLLHLYPVQAIKDEYKITGNAEDVIEAVTGAETDDTIKSFAFKNYPLTRQNTYLFQLASSFRQNKFDPRDFPFTVENLRTENGYFTFNCLPKTIFHVYLSDPVESDELHFHHPVTVRITNDKLVIHLTKLVKNIGHYYPPDRFAKTSRQENTEEEILSDILAFFSEYMPTILDINKGVKHLWDIDDVDSYKIQWRKAFSSASETMNGNMTFKQKYPAEYSQIIQAPLTRTVFKYLKDDGYLCKEFTTDPENGQISINHFSQDTNQVNNVISKILTNN